MAAVTKRRNYSERKRSGYGPFLVAAATIVGLLTFVPGTTAALEEAVTSMIALPRF